MPKQETRLQKNSVGLALGGGAARCLAQIGVLEVLEQEEIPIGAVAGTSAGSIVGALFASGVVDLGELKKIASTLKWRDMVKANFPKRGFISSEKIYRFMYKHIRNMRFEDLKIPLAVVASNLRNGEKVVITTGPVARAVQASCALPIIFTPTELNGELLVDGGATSQLPVLTVKENLKTPFVIAVDVNGNAMGNNRLDNMFQIAIHFISLFARKNAQLERRFADVVIDVDATGVSLIDLNKGPLMMDRGREATLKKLDEIKAKMRDLFLASKTSEHHALPE